MTGSRQKARAHSETYSIFASYSHEDSSLVSQILALYDVTKESIFFDRKSIKPGSKWQTAISHALRVSRKVLVFWCSHSAASVEVRKEYERAIKLRKTVVPVLMDSTVVAAVLREYQWIDLRHVFEGSHEHDHDAITRDAQRAQWDRSARLSAPDWYYIRDVISQASDALARGLESLDKSHNERLVGSMSQPPISQTCPKCQVTVDAIRLESQPEPESGPKSEPGPKSEREQMVSFLLSWFRTGGSVLVACPICGSRWFARESKQRRNNKAAEEEADE
jgi:TIR domain